MEPTQTETTLQRNPPAESAPASVPVQNCEQVYATWVRALMWICIGWATVIAMSPVSRFLRTLSKTDAPAWTKNSVAWYDTRAVLDVIMGIALPLWLFFAARGCQRFNRNARIAILYWAWFSIAYGVYQGMEFILLPIRYGSFPPGNALWWYLSESCSTIYFCASYYVGFSSIILFFLTRDEIRKLFMRSELMVADADINSQEPRGENE